MNNIEYKNKIINFSNLCLEGNITDEALNIYDDILLQNGDFLPVISYIKDRFLLKKEETFALIICSAKLFKGENLPTEKELYDLLLSFGADISEQLPLIFKPENDGKVLSYIIRHFIKTATAPNVIGLDLFFSDGQPLFHSKDCLEKLVCFFDEYTKSSSLKSSAVIVKGDKGSGKQFLIKKFADKISATTIILDLAVFQSDLDDIIIMAQLFSSIIYIKNYSQEYKYLINKLWEHFPVLFFKGDKNEEITRFDAITFECQTEKMSETQKENAFIFFFSLKPNGKALECLKLNPPTIGEFVRVKNIFEGNLLANKSENPSVDIDEILDLFKSERKSILAGSTLKLESNKTLNDIILPTAQKKQLEELCSFVKCKKTVYEQWGFNDKVPYGRGISALFYGASGTGKTATACTIANELGLDLYKIDLSTIISKYIGETQKNLQKIFDEAQGKDCILFFDEADALFARRTDGADVQDKYSNAEIAYLLQRTEQYDGFILLATNLLQNFDEAFRRRIGYIIHFPMPDENLRLKLWENIYPQKAPVFEPNFGLLAKHLELSGAGIKNTAVNSALLAASENGQITMDRIIRAGKAEYQKQGKPFPEKIEFMYK